MCGTLIYAVHFSCSWFPQHVYVLPVYVLPVYVLSVYVLLRLHAAHLRAARKVLPVRPTILPDSYLYLNWSSKARLQCGSQRFSVKNIVMDLPSTLGAFSTTAQSVSMFAKSERRWALVLM